MSQSNMQQRVEESYLNDLLDIDVGDHQHKQSDSISANHVDVVADASSPETASSVDKHEAGINREQPFNCELIMLGKLKLAVPHADFSHILPWPESVSEPAQDNKLILGQICNNDQCMSIIDLHSMIHDNANRTAKAEHGAYKSVILLTDGKTCIPCDDVVEKTCVLPETVTWRNQDSKRMWLAGTVKQEGYAILDVKEIMRLLE